MAEIDKIEQVIDTEIPSKLNKLINNEINDFKLYNEGQYISYNV